MLAILICERHEHWEEHYKEIDHGERARFAEVVATEEVEIDGKDGEQHDDNQGASYHGGGTAHQ